MSQPNLKSQNLMLLESRKDDSGEISYFLDYVDKDAKVQKVPCTKAFFDDAQEKQLTRSKVYEYILHVNKHGEVYSYDREALPIFRSIVPQEEVSNTTPSGTQMIVTLDSGSDEVVFIRPFANLSEPDKTKLRSEILDNHTTIEVDDTLCGKYVVSEIRSKRGVTSFYIIK